MGDTHPTKDRGLPALSREHSHPTGSGSAFVREKGMEATDRNGTGGQAIKRTFVSPDFHKKKWKKLPGEKHSKTLLFWTSKKGSVLRISERGSKKGKGQRTHFYCSHLCKCQEENSFKNIEVP